MDEVTLRQLEVDIVHTFTYSGNLSPESLKMRLYNDSGKDRHIKYVRGSVGEAPKGAPIVVDVLCNDLSIFSRGVAAELDGHPIRPKIEIPVDGFTSISEPKRTLWADGKYLTINIKQIGTTFPGADLTINVVVSE